MTNLSADALISLSDIKVALENIAPCIVHTPIITSDVLNASLGHDLFFKLESQQISGSFKLRGVINTLVNLKNSGVKIKKIVTYGTGNHATALAYAVPKFLDAQVEVFLPSFASNTKKLIIERYGATLTTTQTRQEAEDRAYAAAMEEDVVLIPPSSDKRIIAGAGTVAYEALLELKDIDAIFVPIGGGGLASGTLISAKSIDPKIKVFAGEPKNANDAAISLKQGKIFRFKNSPETLADGARTLGVTELIFSYIKNLDGIFEISEREIAYWTVWFTHLTKMSCEPTSALALAAAFRWLKIQKSKKRVLVTITGANFSNQTYQALYAKDYLETEPINFNFTEE